MARSRMRRSRFSESRAYRHLLLFSGHSNQHTRHCHGTTACTDTPWRPGATGKTATPESEERSHVLPTWHTENAQVSCRHHPCRRLTNCSISARNGASPSTSRLIFSQPCSTVVWSLPPNWRPMSGNECFVSWRARYIATWRAVATSLLRLLEVSTCRGTLKW